jgi:hypothetical protein
MILPHYGRAKTSARLVGTPFGYAPDAPGLSHSPFRRIAHSPRLLKLTRMGVSAGPSASYI